MKTYDATPGRAAADRIHVGVAEYVVAEGGETLFAYGLGGCVGIALYDPAGVGGLAHAMLPEATGSTGQPGTYVDTAVHDMLRDMIEAGAGYGSTEARLVGGADIFDLDGLADDAGARNLEAARTELERLDVPVVAEDVGGSRGRQVEFDTGVPELVVRTADGDESVL